MIAQPFEAGELTVLVQKAQDGDTDAFGKLYDGFFTPIYRYVVFRFPEDLAEDLVADIFVKAWEKLHTYKPYKNIPFSAWLFRIARHSVIDAYRVQRGFEEVPEDIPDEDRWNQPKHVLEQKLSVAVVRGALNKLPAMYRDILLLHFISDLSHSEVAQSLGLSDGFVRVLKHRALKKLEVLLSPYFPHD